MKNSFATHLVVRQIRKHPEPIILKKKDIPNEYLFIDEFSKIVQKEDSLDSQTDVDDFIINSRKNIKMLEKKEDTKDNKEHTKDNKEDKKEEKSFNIECDDENTKEYLKSIDKLNNLMNTIFNEDSSKVNTKDEILDKLETGDITLGSVFSEQSETVLKKQNGRKKVTKKKPSQQLYKDL